MTSPLLDQLIDSLRCLPGVGPKSAQRMAFHLLERNPEGAIGLASALTRAVEEIGNCQSCRTFSETEVCQLCNSSHRDRSILCIVENPADLMAIEASTGYKGLYFVLMGRLSPLDGVGPADIGLEELEKRLSEGEVSEVILATSATIEGEATAHYISELVRVRGIRVSRIAHGVPLGGELEHVDGGTLSHAFAGRQPLSGY